MKIISKYKDFYDYMFVDHDPDLVYVRKEKVCFSMPKADTSYENHWGEGLDKWFWTSSGGYIKAIGYTFGIFPYIYTVPALQISKGSYYYETYLFTKHDIRTLETICKDKKKTRSFFQSIYETAFKTGEHVPEMSLSYGFERNTYNELMRYCWKKENHGFFLKIHSPVFITYAWEILGKTYGYLNDVKFRTEDKDKIQLCDGLPIVINSDNKYVPQLVTNVCFNQLADNIIKYWYDDLLVSNVYSDIENFLMTSKLDPEPKISNEGKIIAHGFDLKTSFRKM